MGLYEKARNLVEARLRALLDPAAGPLPEARLKALILDVDRHRRDLLGSLAQHENERAYFARQAAEKQAALALWKARRELARERGREDLAREAEERARASETELASIERARDLAAAAVANLRVGVERAERMLRFLRQRRRAAAGAAPPDSPAAASAEAAPAASLPDPDSAALPPGTPVDPMELEFQRLELDELARELDRRGRSGGASP